VTACGGGLLRDVLVSDEPLLFKPGQLYVLAALIGASLFTLLILYFKMPAQQQHLLAIGCCFVFRMLAIASIGKHTRCCKHHLSSRELLQPPNVTCSTTSFSLRRVP
jgi:Predicted membrane protein